MKTLTIGQIARRAGVGVETVRFYEREGLLEEPDRRESGYRQYTEEVVFRLRFIRRAKELGFTLKEIRELIALRRDPSATRADVRQQAKAKIADIEAKIRDLQRMKEALHKLTAICRGRGSASGCPILEALDGQDWTPAREGRTEAAGQDDVIIPRKGNDRGRQAATENAPS